MAYLEHLERSLAGASETFGVSIRVGTIGGTQLAQKQHRVFHLAAGAQLVAQLYRECARGIDAAIIGNIQDPALYEARQACSVPVVGLLESALTATRPFAATLGFITTTALTIPLVRERILTYGDERRVVSMAPLGVRLPALLDAFTHPSDADALIATFTERARTAVERGSELVVPAAGMLAELLASRLGPGASWDLGVGAPVLNPVFTAVAAAASAARLATSGLQVSRAGTYAAPPTDLLREFFAAEGTR